MSDTEALDYVLGELVEGNTNPDIHKLLAKSVLGRAELDTTLARLEKAEADKLKAEAEKVMIHQALNNWLRAYDDAKDRFEVAEKRVEELEQEIIRRHGRCSWTVGKCNCSFGRAKVEYASLLARLEKAEGDRDRLLNAYAVRETILPDGELGVTVLDLVEQLEKAEADNDGYKTLLSHAQNVGSSDLARALRAEKRVEELEMERHMFSESED